MRTATVAEVKNNFSTILAQVKNGENVKILFGKAKMPIAMLTPITNKNSPRKIGILNGKASFSMEGDGKISEEEFLSV